MAFDPLQHPIDFVLLAGQRSPGIARVVGASSPREWDERGGYGVSGSFSVFKRRGLAKFSVELKLYSPKDWADWASWKTIVDRLPTRRGGSSEASGYLRIDHPILADLDIKAVGVADVGQPDQTDDGEWTIVIKFIEFRSPKLALARPEEAQAKPEKDKFDTIIENLEATRDRLANE